MVEMGAHKREAGGMDSDKITKALEAGRSAQYRQYVELLNKISSGEVLNPAEQRQFDSLAASLESILDSERADDDAGDLTVSTAFLASFFELTERQIRNWEKAGCPKIRRGRWSLKSVHSWWLENIYHSKDSAAIIRGKEEYHFYKGKNEKLKYEQTLGSLIPQADIHDEWRGVVMEFVAALDHLKTRLPSSMAGLDEHGVRMAVESEVDAIKSVLYETGEFRPGGAAECQSRSR